MTTAPETSAEQMPDRPAESVAAAAAEPQGAPAAGAEQPAEATVQAKRKFVLRALDKGMSRGVASKMTGLSLDEIDRIVAAR